MRSLIVTGTGTDVGKTLLSAMIMAAHSDYYYWKPIQSGIASSTDSETVVALSGCAPSRVLPERYKLREPLSPHLASRLEGVTIDPERLHLPSERPLLIEGAGGVMVPINDSLLSIDLFATWQLPVLLACRSELGTINHTLLTCGALRAREISIMGAVCVGEPNAENEKAIEYYGKIAVLGRIPLVPDLDHEQLLTIYRDHCGKLQEALSL